MEKTAEDQVKSVRLPSEDLANIRLAFKRHFLSDDHLWLFGSRVDLEKRGGDIDLYIETHEPDTAVATKKQSDFVIELWDHLGEQKIDVVLNMLAHDYHLPIYDLAKTEGVLLV